MKPKAGDTVRVQKFHGWTGNVYFETYTLEEYNHCLGFYNTDGPRTPCNFTPLSECYDRAPDADRDYCSNYGGIWTDYIQTFEIITNLA